MHSDMLMFNIKKHSGQTYFSIWIILMTAWLIWVFVFAKYSREIVVFQKAGIVVTNFSEQIFFLIYSISRILILLNTRY